MKKSCLVILFIFLAGFIFPQEILLPYFESGDVILRCTDYVAKYDETHEDVKKKLAYDLLYLRKMCMLLDLSIIFLTAGRITGKGAK